MPPAPLVSSYFKTTLHGADFDGEDELQRLEEISLNPQTSVATSCMLLHEDATVVSEIPPINLLAKERLSIYCVISKDSVRLDLMADLQREWEGCDNGRRTFQLIEDISKCASNNFGEGTFHLTQVVTGHE